MKINYLVLDAKLPLINMNYVDFRNFIDKKNMTKFLLTMVSKRVMLMVDLDEN